MIARDPGGRCSVGTGDRQDLMLARIGLTEGRATEPTHCDDFKDDERVMYCYTTQQFNPLLDRFVTRHWPVSAVAT